MIYNRSGVVLFVVVIVVALVSLAAYSFSILMRTELYAARLHGDQMQSRSMSASGLSYVNSWAESPRSERDSIGGLNVNEALFRNVLVDGYVDPYRPGLFSVVRPAINNDGIAEIDRFSAATEGSPGLAPLTFGVVNESGKLHLQTVLEWENANPGAGRTALLAIPGVTESVADAILDWIDEDAEVREFGAEDEYYQSLNPPRQSANRVPASLEHLLQIRGVTSELLFGFDRNRNFTIEAFERPQMAADFTSRSRENLPGGAGVDMNTESNAAGVSSFDPVPQQTNPSDLGEPIPEPLSRYLTVTSAERNVDYFGRPRLFLNGLNLVTLHRDLESAFGEEVANFIVAIRRAGIYQGSKATSGRSLSSLKSSGNASFEIPDLALLADATVAIDVDGKEAVFESPWRSGGQSADAPSFAEFCDRVTVQDSRVLIGRVCVNIAPREVLMAIPELTADQVDQIIVNRENNALGSQQSNVSRVHSYWLVDEDIFDVKTFERVSRFLTTGGDVFGAQIVGYYMDDSPSHRIEVIVDGTDRCSRPVYYADLTRYGRGFMLDQLAPPTADLPNAAATQNPSTNGIVPGPVAMGQ